MTSNKTEHEFKILAKQTWSDIKDSSLNSATATLSSIRKIPLFIHIIWTFLTSQFAHIILFLTVNVIIGGLGILVPIALEYAATNDFMPALQKQLASASAYTFAIAFLSSCVSLVAAEYLDEKTPSPYRHPKVLLSVFASLIVIMCSVFSGSQAAHSITAEHQPSSSQISIESKGTSLPAQQLTPKAPADEKSESLQSNKNQIKNKKIDISTIDLWQIWITSAAVFVGLILFLLFKYQEPSMRQQLDEIITKFDEEAKKYRLSLVPRRKQ